MDINMLNDEKILIVDDVEANRLILEEIIKNMGYIPILAENGQEALELAKKHIPQLILTDVAMPGMSGYELCREIKKNSELCSIPIIFISSYSSPEDIVEGFKFGGDDYIIKPIIPEVVKARVGVRLSLYETKNELMELNRRLQASVEEQLKQIELEKSNILYALTNISIQNANYETGYMERLRKNCRILAQGMQLSPLYEAKISDTYIDTIELAAPLCDIGYIGIPTDILRKTLLTDEEVLIMQNHTNIGARLISDLYVNSDYNEFISTAIEIAHYHHERWDGGGYPQGLKAEEIPLAAQIISVMERYTSLTEKGLNTREEALEIMRKEAGKKFGKHIFNICDKISRQFC